MCIRDRIIPDNLIQEKTFIFIGKCIDLKDAKESPQLYSEICLLYTSDAADERSSVDLGGRRIIKKTK